MIMEKIKGYIACYWTALVKIQCIEKLVLDGNLVYLATVDRQGNSTYHYKNKKYFIGGAK